MLSQRHEVLNMHFLTFLLIGMAAASSLKDRPNLPESKQKPLLKSGNIVITADPSIVIRSDDPDGSFPPSVEFKQKQGLDTLRGFLRQTSNSTEATLVVFDVPTSVKAKWCSFHFFSGEGDFASKGDTVALWSLHTLPLEFVTSWNHRPSRHIQLGNFYPGDGPALSKGHDSNDAVFQFADTSIIPRKKLIQLDGTTAFPCAPIIGTTAYELVLTNPSGIQTAWSMNKGLMIEIHNSHSPPFPYPNGTHNYTGAPSTSYEGNGTPLPTYEGMPTPSSAGRLSPTVLSLLFSFLVLYL